MTQKNIGFKSIKLSILGLAFVGLSACAMDSPTTFNQKRAIVTEQVYLQEFREGELTPQTINEIARKYDKHGDGPTQVTVTYNPNDKNGARAAMSQASQIAAAFEKAAMRDVHTDILPVHKIAHSTTLVRFNSFTASRPQNCPQTMAEIDDSSHWNYKDYNLGCSVESHLAAQVANPKDLTGRSGMDDAPARRLVNVIEEQYVSGQRNEPLEAVTASE
jgi:type IV pilus biogenesis protein CpaD/CtpE